MSVTARLTAIAQERPDGIAIVFENDSITWSRLNKLVNAVAATVGATAAPHGGIALCLPNCPAFVVLFLGAARAGREVLVLDPQWPEQMLLRTLAETRPALLFGSRHTGGEDAITHVVDPEFTFADLEALWAVSPISEEIKEPESASPFYVGFTSGSTGTPKGYRRSHQSWLSSFEKDAEEFGISHEDVIIAPGTFTHSLYLYAFLKTIDAGAKLVLCRTFQAASVIRLLRRERVTVVYAVPTQYRLLMDMLLSAKRPSVETVRWALSTGAKWRFEEKDELYRIFPKARLAEFYGASELSYVTVARDGDGVPPTSVGRAFSGVAISIRSPDGSNAAPGTPGLIFVESRMQFLGYACGDSGELRRSGNAISVGDVGYLDNRGFLHLVGRADRMIISSGKNIHPEEIEAAFQSHSAVRAAAVIGVGDRQRGQRLAALLFLHDGARITRRDVDFHMRKQVPQYKIPRLIGIVDQWPMTSSGKTDFKAVADLWERGDYERLA